MSTHIENIGNIESAHFHNKSEKLSLPSYIALPKGFIGREVELSALENAKTLGKTAFVLHGAGGVGKTDLALEFIRQLKPDYQAHIRVDMRGLSKNPLLSKDAKLEIIRTFDPKVSANLSEAEINNLYIFFLNQNKTILFFDNAKDREQIEPLNNKAAFIIATSRTNFTVTGGHCKEVEQMSPEDARKLIYSIEETKERFDGQADILASLAGYLPMALLPLASLLAEDVTLEAKDLVQRYSDRKERLQLADPNRENLSVEASFDLSYEQLSDELKKSWRKLAVFPADFDLEAMQAIWEVEEGKEIRSELVKRHLVEFSLQNRRTKLHDLARDYTSERSSRKELKNSEMLHSQHYGKLVSKLNKITPENAAIFDLERVNIETGFSWIEGNESRNNWHHSCFKYLSYSNDILRIKLHPEKYVCWLETGIRAAKKLGDNGFEMSNWANLGIAYNLLSKYEKSIKCFKRTLDFARKKDDLSLEAMSFHELGINFENLGRYRKAISFGKEALKIAKRLNNRELESKCSSNLGDYHSRLGEYKIAETYHVNALQIVHKIGDSYLLAMKSGGLGSFYVETGKYDDGINLLEPSLQSARAFNDKHAEFVWLGSLGNANYRKYYSNEAKECLDKAKEYYEQAANLASEFGDRNGEATNSSNIGNVHLALENYEESIYYFEEGLKVFKELKSPLDEANQLGNLGLANWKLGKKEKAREFYLKALDVFESIESPEAEKVKWLLTELEAELKNRN